MKMKKQAIGTEKTMAGYCAATGEQRLEKVRKAAYSAWEREGRRHGCDKANWYAAETLLGK